MKSSSQRVDLRIVAQERTMAGRTTSFACEGARLHLQFFAQQTDGAVGVRAQAGVRSHIGAEPRIVSGVGATRTEALRAVAEAATADAAITRFDWGAVERLMVEVKSL
jgi:hypothetical protein